MDTLSIRQFQPVGITNDADISIPAKGIVNVLLVEYLDTPESHGFAIRFYYSFDLADFREWRYLRREDRNHVARLLRNLI